MEKIPGYDRWLEPVEIKEHIEGCPLWNDEEPGLACRCERIKDNLRDDYLSDKGHEDYYQNKYGMIA